MAAPAPLPERARHNPSRGAPTISSAQPEHRINERIRSREVRLVDADGTQLGIKPLPEALRLAANQDLDLVEVAPEANPPVCKIMDFAKFKYDMAQRAKESRRKATTTTIKEMKYRVKIGPGDFDTKTRKVGEFLTEGHKVKITIMFRGRENDHPELGMKILDRVATTVGEIGKVEAAPKRDGRNMIMVLAPDKQKQAAKAKSDAEAAKAIVDGEAADAAEAAAGEAAANAATAAAAPTDTQPDAAPEPADADTVDATA